MIADFFIGNIEHLSYIGIFLTLIFAGYVVFIPEEVILLSIGYLAAAGFIKLSIALPVTIIVLILGDYIVFRLARHNEGLGARLKKRVFSLRYIRNHRPILEKHIQLVVLVSRMAPFLRFVGPVLAGAMHVKPKIFLKYNLTGVIAYTPIITLAGYYGHQYFEELLSGFAEFKHFAFIAIAVLVAALFAHMVFHFALGGKRSVE